MTAMVPARAVLEDPRAAGRWRSSASLAAASRRGSGPAGRVLLTATEAAYPAGEIERFFATEEDRRAERLEELRARASHMRDVRARRRAEKASAAGANRGAQEETQERLDKGKPEGVARQENLARGGL